MVFFEYPFEHFLWNMAFYKKYNPRDKWAGKFYTTILVTWKLYTQRKQYLAIQIIALCTSLNSASIILYCQLCCFLRMNVSWVWMTNLTWNFFFSTLLRKLTIYIWLINFIRQKVYWIKKLKSAIFVNCWISWSVQEFDFSIQKISVIFTDRAVKIYNFQCYKDKIIKYKLPKRQVV